jgi:hypothetical protein
LEAELIKGLLEANGIPCEIRDRGQAEVFDGAAPAMTGGAVLRVPENLLEQAREVLEAAREAGKLLPGDSEGEPPEA